MKIKNLIIFLLIAISFHACSQTTTTTTNKRTPSQNNDEIIKELTKFYTLYFTAMENEDVKSSEKNLDALKQQYLSPKLYEKLKKSTLDYDPIINAQDVDSNWRKRLKITQYKENFFQESITTSFENKLKNVFLKLEKTKKGFLISDIKVNDIESILNYKNREDDSE